MLRRLGVVYWIILEEAGTLLEISPSYEALTGRPEREIRDDPMSWIQAIHPDDRDGALKRFLQPEPPDPAQNPAAGDGLECRILRPDGSIRWITLRTTAIRGDDGALIARAGMAEDITETRQALETIDEHQTRLHRVTDQLPGVAYTYEFGPGIKRSLVHLGPGLDKLIGERAAKAVLADINHLFDRLHPDDRSLTLKKATFHAEEGSAYDHECRLLADSGDYVWVRSIGHPSRLDDGTVRWDVVLIDIRDRKRFERAVQMIMAATSSVVGSTFFETLVKAVADSLNVRHVVIAEHLDYPVTRVRTLAFFSDGKLIKNMEYDVRGTPCEATVRGRLTFHAQGVQKMFPDDKFLSNLGIESYCGVPLMDSTGRTLGHIAALDDKPMDGQMCSLPTFTILVTRAAVELERQRAERALRESEDRYRRLVEQAPVGILAHVDDVIVFANGTAADLLGASAPGDLVARSMMEFVHPEQHSLARARIESAADDGGNGVPPGEERFVRLDGSTMDVEVARTGTSYQGHRAVQVTFRDITGQKQVEQERRRRTELERLLLRELDHRVRNNLTSLISLVDLGRSSTMSVTDFAQAIKGRIQTIGHVHSLLSEQRWSTVRLTELMTALTTPDHEGRISSSGPEVHVPSTQASALAMVIHELMTNCAKHGALCSPSGRLNIQWRRLEGSQNHYELRWRETGVSAVDLTPVPGVGTQLIEGLVKSELQGEVDLNYTPDGVSHRFTFRFNPADDPLFDSTHANVESSVESPVESDP